MTVPVPLTVIVPSPPAAGGVGSEVGGAVAAAGCETPARATAASATPAAATAVIVGFQIDFIVSPSQFVRVRLRRIRRVGVVPITDQNGDVGFPIELPIKPMLAKLSRTIPDGEGWLFEPKWDGFRCIVDPRR